MSCRNDVIVALQMAKLRFENARRHRRDKFMIRVSTVYVDSVVHEDNPGSAIG
jgi:hypothetical protein